MMLTQKKVAKTSECKLVNTKKRSSPSSESSGELNSCAKKRIIPSQTSSNNSTSKVEKPKEESSHHIQVKWYVTNHTSSNLFKCFKYSHFLCNPQKKKKNLDAEM